LSGSRHGLIQIGDEIIQVLYPDGKAQQEIRDPEPPTLPPAATSS
jgi:hypothetical protein